MRTVGRRQNESAREGGSTARQAWLMSRFQVIELTASSFLPLTFWMFPYIALGYGGMNALWAVVGVLLAGVFIAYIQGLLNERLPDMTGADFLRVTLGNWLGGALTLLYLPLYMIFNAMCIFFFTLTVKAFFPDSPRAVIAGAMCLVAVRGAWLGVESLGRVASIVHPLTWAGVISVFIAILLHSNHFWVPLRMTSWNETASGIYHLLPIFLGFNLFLMLSPYYEHRKGHSVWFPVISAVIGGSGILTAFLAVVANLGVFASHELSFSVSFVLQLVRLQGWIVERLGILIIILATAFTVLFVSSHFWAMSTLTARLLHNADAKYKVYVMPVAAIVLAITLFLRSDQQAFEWMDRWLVPASWLLLIGLPLLALLVAYMRDIRTESTDVRKRQKT